MRSILAIGLLAALAAPAPAQLVNGGFEDPGQGFRSVLPGQTYGGWTNAGPGDIEFVHATVNPALPGLEVSAYEGQYWIDLVGVGAPSAIYQDVPTHSGSHYEVTFALSGNVWGPPMTMNLNALWNGQIAGSYSHLAQGGNGANMGWTLYAFTVLGTGLDRLTFQATSGGNARGPAIDAVSIRLVPAAPSGALLALAGLAAARRRR